MQLPHHCQRKLTLSMSLNYWVLASWVTVGVCSLSAQTQPMNLPVANSPLAEESSTFQSKASVQLKQRDPRYRIQKSDVIEIRFKFSPEFNKTVTVQPDGFITLDEVGDLKIEGKTLPEVRDVVRHAYEGILRDAVITVSLDNFEHPFFLAGGQVKNPGKYELRGDTTLVEAVTIAGGFTDASKHSQVVLFRRISSDMVEAKVFDVKQMLVSRNLQEDPHLLPGDMLFVPQNSMSKIQHYLPTPGLGAFFNLSQF